MIKEYLVHSGYQETFNALDLESHSYLANNSKPLVLDQKMSSDMNEELLNFQKRASLQEDDSKILT